MGVLLIPGVKANAPDSLLPHRQSHAIMRTTNIHVTQLGQMHSFSGSEGHIYAGPKGLEAVPQ